MTKIKKKMFTTKANQMPSTRDDQNKKENVYHESKPNAIHKR
jgi:hypothetical protein